METGKGNSKKRKINKAEGTKKRFVGKCFKFDPPTNAYLSVESNRNNGSVVSPAPLCSQGGTLLIHKGGDGRLTSRPGARRGGPRGGGCNSHCVCICYLLRGFPKGLPCPRSALSCVSHGHESPWHRNEGEQGTKGRGKSGAWRAGRPSLGCSKGENKLGGKERGNHIFELVSSRLLQ